MREELCKIAVGLNTDKNQKSKITNIILDILIHTCYSITDAAQWGKSMCFFRKRHVTEAGE